MFGGDNNCLLLTLNVGASVCACVCGCVRVSSLCSVPYVEKRRLEDRDGEILEVKRLNRWKPAPVIFTTVMEGCDLIASMSALTS